MQTMYQVQPIHLTLLEKRQCLLYLKLLTILQELYVFFSGSPRRWGILSTQGNLHFSLKSLSVTRWSAHYEAVRAIKNGYMGILQTLKHIFEDSEEKPECKRDAKNLYHKLVKLEDAILTVVWEDVLERFNKTSRKLQTSGFDVFEGYLLLSSLLSFVKELRENSADRIAHYESEAKGLREDITSSYSDASKRIVTRKFSDGTSGIASLRGVDKFRIEVLYQLYDCLIIQLRKRIDPYEQIAKRFKFLSELVNNSEIDEDSTKLIISYYKDDIDHKLVNECYQFKEYLHLRKSQRTEVNTPSKMQCADVLQLICEQHLIEVFPNITTALKLYLTMPITSCEAERKFSKLSFIKNKFQSTITEERLNSLCILSLENDSVRKLSYYKTVCC
ncbi:zinc finger MYM-type protein 1-like [Scyliorhinus torazame]|uniref:zinc finger MYM-type protein 1-like n=1 Tax=Scyliorhinus torazame TaxID=75743 RepID=UPI003B5C703D